LYSFSVLLFVEFQPAFMDVIMNLVGGVIVVSIQTVFVDPLENAANVALETVRKVTNGLSSCPAKLIFNVV
jgi:glycopeptide antibiotics resistance protein